MYQRLSRRCKSPWKCVVVRHNSTTSVVRDAPKGRRSIVANINTKASPSLPQILAFAKYLEVTYGPISFIRAKRRFNDSGLYERKVVYIFDDTKTHEKALPDLRNSEKISIQLPKSRGPDGDADGGVSLNEVLPFVQKNVPNSRPEDSATERATVAIWSHMPSDMTTSTRLSTRPNLSKDVLRRLRLNFMAWGGFHDLKPVSSEVMKSIPDVGIPDVHPEADNPRMRKTFQTMCNLTHTPNPYEFSPEDSLENATRRLEEWRCQILNKSNVQIGSDEEVSGGQNAMTGKEWFSPDQRRQRPSYTSRSPRKESIAQDSLITPQCNLHVEGSGTKIDRDSEQMDATPDSSLSSETSSSYAEILPDIELPFTATPGGNDGPLHGSLHAKEPKPERNAPRPRPRPQPPRRKSPVKVSPITFNAKSSVLTQSPPTDVDHEREVARMPAVQDARQRVQEQKRKEEREAKTPTVGNRFKSFFGGVL